MRVLGRRYRATVGSVSAQPIHEEDPQDPQVILRGLPPQERTEFLRQYHRAAEDASRDVARYKDLQAVLRRWRLVVVAVNQPRYHEDLEAVKNGTARTVPIEAVIPDWEDRVAAARARRE
jgi:hypothetical protein